MAVHSLKPATDRRLGEPLPHQPANQTRVHPVPPEFLPLHHAVLWSYAVLAAVSSCYPPVQARLLTRYSPVRRSVILKASFQNASLDLHVLGTPPAFVLSQDQTLLFNLDSLILLILRYPFGINFVVQNILSCFDLSFFSSLCTFQGAFPLPPWPPATVGLLIISNLLPFVNSFLPFF